MWCKKLVTHVEPHASAVSLLVTSPSPSSSSSSSSSSHEVALFGFGLEGFHPEGLLPCAASIFDFCVAYSFQLHGFCVLMGCIFSPIHLLRSLQGLFYAVTRDGRRWIYIQKTLRDHQVYAVMRCWMHSVGWEDCDFLFIFYHPATCEATGCLQRVYLHFWMVDASLHGWK